MTQYPSRARIFCTVFTVIFGIPALSFCGNTRAYFMGDEAAMTAGAGTAIISDAGMLWYNPAGLGGIVLNNLQLSGSIFNGKIRRVPNFMSADLPGGRQSRDATGDAIGSIPGSASVISNASPTWSWGLGFFAADVDYIELTADIIAPLESEDGTWHQKAAAYISKKNYYLGPSIGWALTPKLRLGLSLFVSYHSRVHDLYASAARVGSSEVPESAFLSYAEHAYTGDFAVMLRGGLQWEFADRWHFGVVISSPVTTISTLSDSSTMRTQNAPGDSESEEVYVHEFSDNWDWKFRPREAASFSVALAYKQNGRFWVGAEGEIRPPLTAENLNLLWNACIGGRLYLSENLNWGLGLFTDNSPNPAPKKALENQINRYGISTGMEMRLPTLSFKGKAGDRKFVWAVSASITYSLEVGKVGTLLIAPSEENPFSFPTEQVFFHQGVLYVGSTLYF